MCVFFSLSCLSFLLSPIFYIIHSFFSFLSFLCLSPELDALSPLWLKFKYSKLRLISVVYLSLKKNNSLGIIARKRDSNFKTLVGNAS